MTYDDGEPLMTRTTPLLMFKDQLEAAMEFYAATFRDSDLGGI